MSWTSTSKLLTQLGECVRPRQAPAFVSAQNLTAPLPAPTPASIAPAAPTAAPMPAAVAKAEYQVEAMKVATDVLQTAGFREFSFLSGADVPEGLRNYDAVWSMSGGAGTLRILPDPASTLDEVKAILIGLDAGNCKGTFASGIKPAADEAAATVFTACEAGGKRSEHSYIILRRKPAGHYVFALVLNGENRPFGSEPVNPDQTSDDLRQAAMKVIQ